LLAEGGTARRAAIAKTVEGLGGKLESFYFAFGDADVYVTVDMPDNVAATAVALAVNQSGAATGKAVVPISPEEMDKSSKKAVDYRIARALTELNSGDRRGPSRR
jgi:uncharacterized protein with GYD domain